MKQIIIDMIILVFPILLYFIYSIDKRIIEIKENNLIFEFCIIISIVLLLNFSLIEEYNFLFLNSLLILSYYKKNLKCSNLISLLILILCYINNYEYFYIFTSLYFFYFLWNKYNLCNKKVIYIINIMTSLIFITILNKKLDIAYISYLFVFYIFNYILIMLVNKLEEVLILYKTIKNINEEKTFITSIFKITHEIKNPLAVCKGYLDMYDVNNIEHSRNYIPIIQEEINRTLFLLNDFLSINKLNLNLDIMDINLLLDKIVNNYKRILKFNNIQLEYYYDEEEIYINGDYNRLSQVLVNIIKNAQESIENEGFIKIDTKIENNYFITSITDNGIGIEDIEKIKELFYTTKQNGTGIGVPLSIEVIKKHNGFIEYKKLEHGTSVIIKLPILEF